MAARGEHVETAPCPTCDGFLRNHRLVGYEKDGHVRTAFQCLVCGVVRDSLT